MTELFHLLTLVVLMQGFRNGSAVRNPPTVQEMQEMRAPSLGGEDSLEEEMATHSSILA